MPDADFAFVELLLRIKGGTPYTLLSLLIGLGFALLWGLASGTRSKDVHFFEVRERAFATTKTHLHLPKAWVVLRPSINQQVIQLPMAKFVRACPIRWPGEACQPMQVIARSIPIHSDNTVSREDFHAQPKRSRLLVKVKSDTIEQDLWQPRKNRNGDEQESIRRALMVGGQGAIRQITGESAADEGDLREAAVVDKRLGGRGLPWKRSLRDDGDSQRLALAHERGIFGCTTDERSAADGRDDQAAPGIGVLISWMSKRGFGFIRPEGGGKDLFCHVSCLVDGEANVPEGSQVTYVPQWNAREEKILATNVRLVTNNESDYRIQVTERRPDHLAPETRIGALKPWASNWGFGSIQPVGTFRRIGYFNDTSADIHFEVAVRPDAKSTANRFRLVFTTDLKKTTLGFILIDISHGAFIMKGMRVNDKFRGRGFSTLFTAIWLSICFSLDMLPRTIKMKKPLICLTLQRFGFTPCKTTFEIEVGSKMCDGGPITLWSKQMAKLRTVFSKSYLKTQNMIITNMQPAQSKTIYVDTPYEPQDLKVLREQVDATLQGRLSLIAAKDSSAFFNALRHREHDGRD